MRGETVHEKRHSIDAQIPVHHIAHLDEQMVTKTEFNEKIENLKEQMVTKPNSMGRLSASRSSGPPKPNSIVLRNNLIVLRNNLIVLKEQFSSFKEQFNGTQRSGGIHEMADYVWFRLARRIAGVHKLHQVGANKARQCFSEVPWQAVGLTSTRINQFSQFSQIILYQKAATLFSSKKII